MDKKIGILFSYAEDSENEKMKLALEHLKENKELYWSVGFPVKTEEFSFPIEGLMHEKGDNIRYRCNIIDIKPYHPSEYQDAAKKAEKWRIEWNNNPKTWKVSLVINKIEKFYYETREVVKVNGEKVTLPPRRYIKVYIPEN